MMFASARICVGQDNIIFHVFNVLSWRVFGFFMKVLTALDFDIGVRLGVPYLQLLPPMVVGQIRVRANMLDEPFRVQGPQLPVLRPVQPERREPLMLEDKRRDEVEGNGRDEENGEEEEGQEGSPQKSDEYGYVLV